jgi:hypothetical protein
VGEVSNGFAHFSLRRRAAGETLVEIARSFNVSHMTIARL